MIYIIESWKMSLQNKNSTSYLSKPDQLFTTHHFSLLAELQPVTNQRWEYPPVWCADVTYTQPLCRDLLSLRLWFILAPGDCATQPDIWFSPILHYTRFPAHTCPWFGGQPDSRNSLWLLCLLFDWQQRNSPLYLDVLSNHRPLYTLNAAGFRLSVWLDVCVCVVVFLGGRGGRHWRRWVKGGWDLWCALQMVFKTIYPLPLVTLRHNVWLCDSIHLDYVYKTVLFLRACVCYCRIRYWTGLAAVLFALKVSKFTFTIILSLALGHLFLLLFSHKKPFLLVPISWNGGCYDMSAIVLLIIL